MNKKIQTRLLSSFFALIILYSTFYQAYVSVYFFAYQDYITKELCVQKDNQQGCNGKCYLMKKLNNEVSEKKATTPSQNEKEFRGYFNLYFALNSSKNFKYNADLQTDNIEYHSLLKHSFFIQKETPPPQHFI